MIHVCYSRNLIKRGWFMSFRMSYPELAGMRPRCTAPKCGKLLRVGDYVDGHYPYDVENNRCKECVEKSRTDEQN